MSSTLHSSRLQIPWTNISTDGVDRGVVALPSSSLTLFFGLQLDGSLYGASYIFYANFRIEETATGQIFNHLWVGDLDGFQQYGTSIFLVQWWSNASTAGVASGTYNVYPSPRQEQGLYRYRPYFTVVGFNNQGGLEPERSEYAVAEDHYFVLSGSNLTT
jgi:hypothetical protein